VLGDGGILGQDKTGRRLFSPDELTDRAVTWLPRHKADFLGADFLRLDSKLRCVYIYHAVTIV
jgi:hypothetical protein